MIYMARKPNGNYKQVILNKITENYPLGVRYTDLEKVVTPGVRPNIHLVIKELMKEKKIVREKPCETCRESYYRLVI